MTTSTIARAAGLAARVMMITAATIGYSSATAGAATMPDPMRCEALKLKCDSRYHMCLSRCDAIADRRAVSAPEDSEGIRSNCSNACDVRHENAELRLKQRPVCDGGHPDPVPPDPQACAAKLLWIKSDYVHCKGRCHARFDQRPAFDCSECLSGCYDVYRSDTATTIADPICADGPAEEVPLEPPPAAPAPTN